MKGFEQLWLSAGHATPSEECVGHYEIQALTDRIQINAGVKVKDFLVLKKVATWLTSYMYTRFENLLLKVVIQ